MKNLFFLLFLLCIFGCTDNGNTNYDILKLQRENDSLKTALKDYKEKYVYNFVTLRQAPAKGNSYKKGSFYKGEISFLPTNKEDFILFGTEIRKMDDGTEIINPDTLRPSKGVYTFKTKLLTDTTRIYFKPLIKNELALVHMNSFYNELSFSDEIITE